MRDGGRRARRGCQRRTSRSSAPIGNAARVASQGCAGGEDDRAAQLLRRRCSRSRCMPGCDASVRRHSAPSASEDARGRPPRRSPRPRPVGRDPDRRGAPGRRRPPRPRPGVADQRTGAGGDRRHGDRLAPSWAPAGPRPLRGGSLGEVRQDRDVVAVVPATASTRPCPLATVDGRRPAALTRRATRCRRPRPSGPPAPPAVTTVTVTGDVMLGRRVGDRLAAVGDPAAALRPMAHRLAAADLTIGNLEGTLSTGRRATPGRRLVRRLALGARGPAACRLRRPDAGQQPHGGLRDACPGRDRPPGAGRRVPAAGSREGPRAAAAARRRRAQRARRSGWSRSTPSASRRAPAGAGRACCASGCSPAPAPSTAATSTGSPDRHRPGRTGSTWSSCCRTGARSTPIEPCSDQRRVARTLVDAGADVVVGGPPALGAGSRGGPRRVRRVLARELRVRHGLQPQDPGGRPAGDGRSGATGSRARPVPYVIGSDFAPRIARGARG